MRPPLLAAILVSMLALPAAAGPWPRVPGAGFLSATAGIEDLPDRRAFVEVYAEHGVARQLVLGAHFRRAGGRLRTDVLARWHPDLLYDLALGLTLGVRLREPRSAAPILAAHLGRGAETRLGNLWARADVQAVANRSGIGERFEADLSGQIGFRSHGGALAMLTLAEHRNREGGTLKLTPALGHEIGARTTLVLGATLLPRAQRVDGAQLSLWFDY
jgi:hypothetical protein